MALKKLNKKQANKIKDVRQELMKEINQIEDEIGFLQEKKTQLQASLLEMNIAPFKIGGYALVKVPSGKSTKEQKCLLECVGDTLYVRPLKEDGELSGRHFSVIPFCNETYADYLKEVK